jgi:fatty-acyl-CoA synthase
MVVVPVMLQRILDVGEDKIKDHDLSNLRIIFVSGSALGVDVTKRALKAFGPVIYNLYGSTEISYATIATPDDLKAEPGSVGKVVRGSLVKIYDDEGKQQLPQGETGRIFVGNLSQFEGYTGGGSKDEVDGLMASGDVGYFDQNGRLFIEGRDDEMIVSGGENVFPAEVEDLLAGHEAVEEVAVIGVDDEKFGQRLKAFVVLRSGADLSEDDAKDYVKKNLAGYKSPREVVFIDELPRNSTGKVLKRELADKGDREPNSEGSPKSKSSGNGSRSGNRTGSGEGKKSRTSKASSKDKTS